MRQRYTIFLTKSEVNKLHKFVHEHKRSETPIHFRHQLEDLYLHANNLKENGGGA